MSASSPADPLHDTRVDFIDSIRGIAAFAVFYLHAAEYFSLRNTGSLEMALFKLVTTYVDSGKAGVVLFFAVSGFVIPFSLLGAASSPVRSFAVNRFFRLYPVYWLSIAAGLWVLWEMRGKAYGIGLVLLNGTMLQQFFGAENIIGVYWTLQMELIFYVLCVALFLRNALHKPRIIFLMSLAMLLAALVLAALRFVLERKLPVALPLALALMFWGCQWRRQLLNADAESRRYSRIFLILFAVAMPLIALLAYNKDMGFRETWYRYTLSYFAGVGGMLLLTTVWRLRHRAFVWLGRISYGVYLFHPVVLALYIMTAPHWMATLPSHLQIALVAAGVLLVSDLLHRLLEKPLIRTGRALNRWLDRRGAPGKSVNAA